MDIINEIENVLSRYFACDAEGNPNPDYEEWLSATQAIDEIVEIIKTKKGE